MKERCNSKLYYLWCRTDTAVRYRSRRRKRTVSRWSSVSRRGFRTALSVVRSVVTREKKSAFVSFRYLRVHATYIGSMEQPWSVSSTCDSARDSAPMRDGWKPICPQDSHCILYMGSDCLVVFFTINNYYCGIVCDAVRSSAKRCDSSRSVSRLVVYFRSVIRRSSRVRPRSRRTVPPAPRAGPGGSRTRLGTGRRASSRPDRSLRPTSCPC
ncbi:hypothetical protein SAMN05444342_1184 [Haladaptatus paucihalophilus DX253]|uniref:Uncharacterized protein n=1 Tax=Haladaptatus paucihalophilus DX253 TaxID=797209 RepID=A0A1M6R617_HALPU|nr:hypothetical protein SAMN05444342_1184 [Haladaptatus paucihalophilus DX253]